MDTLFGNISGEDSARHRASGLTLKHVFEAVQVFGRRIEGDENTDFFELLINYRGRLRDLTDEVYTLDRYGRYFSLSSEYRGETLSALRDLRRLLVSKHFSEIVDRINGLHSCFGKESVQLFFSCYFKDARTASCRLLNVRINSPNQKREGKKIEEIN